VGDDLAGAANGGDEVVPEVVVGEEMVLGAGAGEVDVDITRAASGGEEGGPGRAARLGVAGKTAVLSCTAGPLSDPKEGEVRWRGVRLGVAENFDHPEGSTLLPPSPPWWGGGRGTWL
jgi:hypothetical protein